MHKTWLLTLLAISLIITLMYSMSFLKTALKVHDTNIFILSARQDPPADNFTYCLLDAQRVFSNLSLSWFLAFGTALMYYRSNNFVSDDIDIGIFIDDLKETNISDTKFVSTVRKYGFKLLFTYGSMTHGQAWTFECPRFKMHFDIFVFYHANLTNNETFSWWAASYNGLCNKLRYHKCRWWFSDFKPNTFKMYGQQFHIAPKQFILEQYGPQYMIPRKYGYFESLKFLPNLIDEH